MIMIGRGRSVQAAALILVVGGAVTAQQKPAPSVTYQHILAGLKDSSSWLTFSGDYTGQRHSPLEQISARNVTGLLPQWVFQTEIQGFPGRGIETTPIVFDGVMP